MYFEAGGKDLELGPDELKAGLEQALEKLGERHSVLALPPECNPAKIISCIVSRVRFDVPRAVLDYLVGIQEPVKIRIVVSSRYLFSLRW